MSESEVIRAAVEGFYEFYGEQHSFVSSYDSVEELIACWLTDGKAVEDCRCNYAVFLSAVACIFAEAHDERCVKGKKDGVSPSRIANMRHVHMPVDENDPNARTKSVANIFDPYVFIAAVEEYRLQHTHVR